MIMTLALLISTVYGQAQGIAGMVVDEKKEPAVNATVQAFQNGVLRGGTITDYDDKYVIKPLDAGYYDLVVFCYKYDTVFILKVPVASNYYTTCSASITRSSETPGALTVLYMPTRGDIPPVPTNHNGYEEFFSARKEYEPRRGESIYIAGNRTSGTVYSIGGLQVQDNQASKTAPKQVETFTPPGQYIIKRDEMGHLPATNINDIASTLPGVYQQRRGDELHVYGSR